MNSYLKIYHLEPRNSLPKLIYLDKQAVFSFGVYLSIRTAKQSSEPPAVCNISPHPIACLGFQDLLI